MILLQEVRMTPFFPIIPEGRGRLQSVDYPVSAYWVQAARLRRISRAMISRWISLVPS